MDEKQRVQEVRSLAQFAGWDTAHFDVSNVIRALLKSIIDQGTAIDSGGGPESSDLWFTIGGVEYYLNVRRSNKEASEVAADA